MFNISTTTPDTTMNDEMAMIMLFVIYGVIFGGLFLFLFLQWIFKAIAVFKMSKKLNLSMPWFGFVPYCLPFAYGRIAEMYNKNHFKKPVKFSILLLILQFVPGVAVTIFYVFFFASALISAIFESEILLIISLIVWYFVMIIIMIATTFVVNFFNYLACWNVLSIFGGEKNILLFILSITLGIEPFVLFALRNKEPQNLKEEVIIPETIEVLEN